jgi:hypothetical protein
MLRATLRPRALLVDVGGVVLGDPLGATAAYVFDSFFLFFYM